MLRRLANLGLTAIVVAALSDCRRAAATEAEIPSDSELEAAIAEDLNPGTKTTKPAARGQKPRTGAPQQRRADAPSNAPIPLNSAPLASPATSPSQPPPVAGGLTALPTTPQQSAPLSLVDSFSPEKNPGRGTLSYRRLDQTETIELGTDEGHFGFGLVFRNSTLPAEFIRDHGQLDVIQFAFGTTGPKLGGRVPEFSTVAIFTKTKPKEPHTFPLAVGTQRKPGEEFGLVLFTSPTAAAERSDEEKLRQTFFSTSGDLRIVATGSTRGLDVDIPEKKVAFKMQSMKLDFEAVELATPFNPQKNSLSGSVEIPVYWPESPSAISWVKRIAFQSLLASQSVHLPRGNASEKQQR